MSAISKFAVVLAALVSMPAFAGEIRTEVISSEILDSDIVYNVFLPDGYDPSRHYPVIYLLHGLTDTYTAWVERGHMTTVADELMRSGECRPAVIIMPNAGGPDTYSTWNGYFNMPGWNYEDFFFGEFIPAVESKYNAGGSKGMRAVMGLSMGGGGSTVYCQHHPDMFSSCYAMSAWLDNKSEFAGNPNAEGKLYYVKKAVCDNSALDFANNSDAASIEAMRSVKWFFDCGDDDGLLYLSVALHHKLLSEDIHSELRVRDGVHNWEYWHISLRTALPFASRNFSL